MVNSVGECFTSILGQILVNYAFCGYCFELYKVAPIFAHIVALSVSTGVENDKGIENKNFQVQTMYLESRQESKRGDGGGFHRVFRVARFATPRPQHCPRLTRSGATAWVVTRCE